MSRYIILPRYVHNRIYSAKLWRSSALHAKSTSVLRTAARGPPGRRATFAKPISKPIDNPQTNDNPSRVDLPTKAGVILNYKTPKQPKLPIMNALNPKHRSWPCLAALLVVCFGAAGIGGAITHPHIASWYATLTKPAWTPPAWLFGPVWSFLYLTMAIAAWLVWLHSDFCRLLTPMALFGIQLLLNVAWSWLFFGCHNPGLAFLDLVLLWTFILLTTVSFWRRSTPAGILMTPYLAWVSFAGVLNFAIWRMNG
jgi:translocator protein